MFGETFFNDTMRKYVTYFGTLFNDIRIERNGPDGKAAQILRVPLIYSPRQHYLVRLNENPDLLKPTSLELPRLTFEMTGYQYDPTRHLTSLTKYHARDVSNSRIVHTQYTPVPYNLNFTLNIVSKNAEDANRIVEQILPFFTPAWTSTLNLIPALGLKVDVPVTLMSTNIDDTWQGAMEGRRFVVHELNFTMKAAFYGPIEKKGIIKKALVSIFADSTQRAIISVDPLNSIPFQANEIVYQGNSTVNNAVGTVLTSNSSLLTINIEKGIIQGGLQIRSTTSNAYATVTGVKVVSVPTEVISVTPGLTANGLPTTNPNDAIDPLLVQPEDPYAFLIQYAASEDDL